MLRRRVTKFTPAQKVTGQWMPMILLSFNQLPTCAKIEILIKLFLKNVEIFHNCLKLPFFGLKIRLLFYCFVSEPVSDPDSNPDSNPDPKCLFWIRIGSGQKFRILTDPVPDPQHWTRVQIPIRICEETYIRKRIKRIRIRHTVLFAKIILPFQILRSMCRYSINKTIF